MPPSTFDVCWLQVQWHRLPGCCWSISTQHNMCLNVTEADRQQ